ncbi:glycosyltransferase [Pseudochelatococcus contaminans]|uniref:Cellulose synthase/poly-beta-1,6-N-acetylglucosamine synthase-like glycosyltransferase n=1 Tax=Pseudochelatococcus contaminans TaxID=1538103 RepID=A0A7W5Z721_9HYPH|nr:glycosyltransferase [Pseudochelatococcus contaminans]MBB3811345.1 cellulose synthase/poly-beta-1,6-N-acetylglucosamine synthase-like glycosyltransferase [Pseudochelatococcus contaminans]
MISPTLQYSACHSINAGSHRDEHIPPELSFLHRHGIPQETLALAVQWARHLRVSPVDAAIGQQLISEDTYYHALAQELGLPLLPDGARIAATARYPRIGPCETRTPLSLPLELDGHGLCVVVAPNGSAAAAMLQRREEFPRDGVAMTSPSRLETMIRHHFAADIAEDAAMGLSRLAPALSCHGGLSRRQRATLAGISVAFAATAIMSPLLLVELFMLGCGVVFLAMSGLRIACVAAALRTRTTIAPPLTDAELPLYSVIVPLFREMRVIPQLLHALMALDYPPAKLDIKLVLEAHDAETHAAIAAYRLPAHIRVVTVPSGSPVTKPRALNVALAAARGRHVVIYDAEDIPDPHQLRKAAAIFRAFPDVACVQARIVIDNPADGFIASMFAIEYAALFDAINPGLAAMGLPILLGGTSNHLRTDVLRDIGGWDAWNVTEDADLGIRLARHGHRIMDLPSVTREEAPFRWRAWINQRSRWLKGWMQVCITHSRHPRHTWRDLGAVGSLAACALTMGTLLGALCMPLFILATAWTLVDWAMAAPHISAASWPLAMARGFSLIVMVCGTASFVLPVLVGLARRRRLALLWLLPLSPLYFLMITVAAWRGVRDLIRNPSHWRKTGHGLSRRRWSVRVTDT